MKICSGLGVVAFAIAAPITLAAQQPAPATTPSAPPGFEIPKDMTTYYVALYVKGPKHMATESPEHTALTQRHLGYIRRMIEEHKYLIAGHSWTAETNRDSPSSRPPRQRRRSELRKPIRSDASEHLLS